MTSRKPPAEDTDIIEGVAVEKADDGDLSGDKRSGGRPRRRAAKGSASATKPGAANTKNKPETEQAATRPDDDTGSNPSSPAHGGPSGPSRLPAILAGFAVVISLAGVGLQMWRSGTEDSALRGEIDDLVTRLAAAEADVAAARAEAMNVKAVLAELADTLPPDLSEELAALVERQDVLESGLAAVEAEAPAPLASGGDVAQALAQSGMGVAAAMINDSLSGGDPSRWLATLSELRAAGLAVGDLDALRAAMIPMPATHGGLLADAQGLIEPLRQNAAKDGHDGWWSAATGRLSDFVSLRRQDDMTGQNDVAAADAPLRAFERAVQAGRLDEALTVSADLGVEMAALEDWRMAVERRLFLDDSLAEFSANMAALLARARTGKAG